MLLSRVGSSSAITHSTWKGGVGKTRGGGGCMEGVSALNLSISATCKLEGIF